MLQKSYRKVFALLLAFTFVLCNVTPGFASGFMSITEITPYSTGKTNASTIYFGKNSKGTETELNAPIQWRVLAVNVTDADTYGNRGVLLLSQNTLYTKEFSPKSKTNKWGISTIRADMSGLNSEVKSDTETFDRLADGSFAKGAFEAAEYNAILDTTHKAGGYDLSNKKAFISDATSEDIGREIKSTDRIFLLSINEARNTGENGYFTGSDGDNTDRQVTADVNWWLRSPEGDKDSCSIYYVSNKGNVSQSKWGYNNFDVRPALNLNPDAVLFLTAAEGGKGSSDCGGAFGLDNDYTGDNGWKVTLKDAYDVDKNPNGIKSPVVSSSDTTTSNGFNVNTLAGKAGQDGVMNIGGGAQKTGTTHYISYNEDTAGTNMYVSALLYASDGTTMANYAKVASVGSDASKSGVFALNLSNAENNQKIKFFAEQENGDKMTDYASVFSDAYDVPAISTEGDVIKILNATEYADKGLTANLFAGGELEFGTNGNESNYDTNVIVDANNTGKITVDATSGTTLTGDVTVGSGASLTMANQFNLEGTLYANNSTLNCGNLTLAQSGFINMNDKDWDGAARDFRTLTVSNGSFTANGGTFVINTNLANTKTGETDKGDLIKLNGSVTGNAYVQVAYDPSIMNGGTVEGEHTFLTATSGTITITAKPYVVDKGGNTLIITPTVANGTGGTDASNSWKITSLAGEIKEKVSETTKSVSDTAQTIGMAWISIVNNLQKRLGDLRSGAESNTGWARFQRNNDDVKTGRNFNVSGNLYQIGYDFALKNDTQARGYFGLSLEHFDGNQSFGIGNGDLKSTSVGAYYTKIYNSGHYFDFILRYGRYDSDTTSYDQTTTTPTITKLDYAVNSLTLSGEYGYRAKLGKSGLYLEPQAEFIYGYLSGAKKTSSTGLLADIDSTNHFVSRLGVALGQKVKNFNYYLRGSYYHDFAGTTNITYGDTSYKQDSAQNWWEVSLGGGWNVSDTSYFYAELTKHFKDISNSLNFNVGFRFTL